MSASAQPTVPQHSGPDLAEINAKLEQRLARKDQEFALSNIRCPKCGKDSVYGV